MIDRMKKSVNSQDTMLDKEHGNNVIETDSPSKLIASDNELRRKVEPMTRSHGEESSSNLPQNDETQDFDCLNTKRQTLENRMHESSDGTRNDVILWRKYSIECRKVMSPKIRCWSRNK